MKTKIEKLKSKREGEHSFKMLMRLAVNGGSSDKTVSAKVEYYQIWELKDSTTEPTADVRMWLIRDGMSWEEKICTHKYMLLWNISQQKE